MLRKIFSTLLITASLMAPVHAGSYVFRYAVDIEQDQAGLTAPEILSLTPNAGPTAGGDTVTISGVNFSSPEVFFDGLSASVVGTPTSESVQVLTPARSWGTVDVAIVNSDNQSAALSQAYTYSAPAPTLSSISPTSGSSQGGETITLAGTNFMNGVRVFFGGIEAAATFVNSATLTAIAPARTPGTVNITVENPDGKSVVQTGAYQYLTDAPTLGSLSPVEVDFAGGTSVALSGSSFLPETQVRVNGVSVGTTYASSLELSFTAPGGTAGTSVPVATINTDGVTSLNELVLTFIEPLLLSLASATLPEATVGQVYNYDFKPLATLTGTYAPQNPSFGWGEATPPPAGLALGANGVLSGTPTTAGTENFEVIATYENNEGRRVYVITVGGVPMEVTQISAGNTHACAVTTSGGAKCWGHGANGRLGDGTTTQRLAPVNVFGLTSGVASISAGLDHTCAVTTSGGAKCWGNGANGRLGYGDVASHLTPTDVFGLTSGVASISTGDSHTCAVTTSGGAKCWGVGSSGRLGDGSGTQQLTPINVFGLTSGVASISTGVAHTCAIHDGAAKCWGFNGNGRLGDGTATNRFTPVDVSDLTSGVASISAGNIHTCAVTTSGVTKCWGGNHWGQIGDGTTTERRTPVNVSDLASGVASISARNNHSCAVTTSGGAKCWGTNGGGQIGDGTTTQRLTPVNVFGLTSGVAAISTGNNHTCAVTTSGDAKCWGAGASGQLGDGTTAGKTTPVNVLSQ